MQESCWSTALSLDNLTFSKEGGSDIANAIKVRKEKRKKRGGKEEEKRRKRGGGKEKKRRRKRGGGKEEEEKRRKRGGKEEENGARGGKGRKKRNRRRVCAGIVYINCNNVTQRPGQSTRGRKGCRRVRARHSYQGRVSTYSVQCNATIPIIPTKTREG